MRSHPSRRLSAQVNASSFNLITGEALKTTGHGERSAHITEVWDGRTWLSIGHKKEHKGRAPPAADSGDLLSHEPGKGVAENRVSSFALRCCAWSCCIELESRHCSTRAEHRLTVLVSSRNGSCTRARRTRSRALSTR